MATAGLVGLVLLSTVLVTMQVLRMYRLNLYMRIVHFLWKYLPHVGYAGLGPPFTKTSPYCFMSRGGFECDYSWKHDLFGSELKVVFVFSQCFVIVVGFTVIGGIAAWRSTGWNRDISLGMISGTVAGATMARLSLPVMNYLLGAGEFLTAAIENELKCHQPHKHITKGASNRLDYAKISGAVQAALHQIDAWGRVDGKDELKHKIECEGQALLTDIGTWLVSKYSGELVSHEGPCWRLYSCGRNFACAEHEMVALSFLDMPLFLIVYFDPHWKVLDQLYKKHFSVMSADSGERKTHKHGWTRAGCLDAVYISNPDVKICEQDVDGFWQIKDVSFNRQDSRVSRAFRYYGGYKDVPKENEEELAPLTHGGSALDA